MQRFIALFLCEPATLDAWGQTPEAERKTAEAEMMHKWQEWAASLGSALIESNGTGKTVRITPEGAAPHRNNLMLYSIVEAPDMDAAQKMFIGHPHLAIPTASIEIMPANRIPDGK